MADFGVTGEVVVTSEKAEAAFDRVGDKATQMANEVASAAGKAGQAVDGVGAGAEKSADKFTRAESRMRDAIKRSTQELQLLGKTASEKLEFNIQAKGLDAAKFAPYIEELKKAEAAQKIATGSLDKMGVSAAQTAAALRGVPAQFTDIITTLQAGHAPLTVFLQQGGQLKDMFGGAGAAARALGGYVAGLINPFTLAAVAVGGLGLAYAAGSKEADGYRQALVLTGNQAGSTVGQMQQMAQQIAGVTGSQREAAAALAEFASSGKVGQENLRQFTQTAIEFRRVTGQSVDAVAKNFADLAKDPLKATLKLNESMNYLTESIFRQIQSLQDQGRETEAANVAQKAYADTLNERNAEIVRNLGTIEKAWAAIKKEANSAMDAFLDIGRLSTLETRLQRAQSALQSYQSTLPGRRTTAQVAAVEQFGGEEGLKREIAGLKDLIENQRKSAEMERERATAVKASTDLATDALKYESELEKQRRAVFSATEKYQTALAKGNLTAEQRNQLEADYLKLVSGITAVKEKKGGSGGIAAENKGLRDQQRIFAELADVSSTYYADLEKAQQQRAKGNLSEAQYVKYVEELIQKQPFAVAQEKARAEAIKESAKAASESSKALSAWYDAREKESQGFANQINARREEVSMMGMTAEAVVAYTQAKYEQQAAEKEAYAAALESASFYAGEYAEAYNIAAEAARNQAKQLRELGGLEVEKANKDAAKKAKDEWQRAADDINRSLTDALLRGFESGKGFAENLRDTLKNMFSTLVLRPIISAALSPVAGAVSGLVGNAVGGAAAGSGIGSSIATSIGTSAIGSAFSLGLTNFGTGLGSTLANGVLGGIGTNISNFGTLAGAGNLSGALGVAAPYLAAIGALYAIISSLDDSGTYHTGGAAQYSGARGLRTSLGFRDNEEGLPSYNPNDNIDNQFGTGFGYVERGDQTISAVGSIAQGLGTALDGIAVAFGQTAGYEIATAFADDTSKDGAWGALRISKDGQELLNWQDTRTSRWAPKEFGDGEEGYKQYLAAVAKDTRQILLDMDLPSWADKMLESLGDSVGMDQLQAVIAQIGAIQTAFVGLGKVIDGFAGMTDKAFEAIMKASGGIEALSQNAATYYQNFYSEEERTTKAREQVQGRLTELGVTGIDFDDPKAREQYRKAVEDALARANTQQANREAVTAALSNMDLSGITAGGIGDVLSGIIDTSEATPEALQGLARAMQDLGASATGLQDFEQAVAAYINANAEALGVEDDAAALAAGLLDLSGAFAAVTRSAEQEAARLMEIESKRGDLTQRLLRAEGKDREALDLQRAKENEALMALDPELAKLAYRLWLLEDAAQAAADKVAAQEKSYRNLQAAYDRERKVLEAQLDGIDQARTYFQEQQSLASESLGLITGVFDLLHDSVQNLYGDVEAAAAMQAEQGRAFIAQALATAVTTGYLPEQDQLSEAIRAAVAGVNSGTYANTTEQDFAKLVLAGQLRALEEVAGKQKTDAEKQLDALEKQLKSLDDQTDAIEKQLKLQQESLDYWQEQIDIANGAYDATLSVEQAVRDLAALLGAEVVDNPPEPANGGGSGGGGAVFGGGSGSTPAPAPARYSRLIYGGTAGVGYEGIRDQSLIDRLDKLSPVYHSFDGTGDLVGLAAAMKAAGGTIADLSILSGNWESDWRKAFAGVGIPAFAVGTNYVPRDMVAQIHEGEAIVPKAFNPWAGGSMGSDNAALIAELRALRAEVAELRTAAEETAGATGATADVLVRVTQNGNGMVTAAAPI